MLHIFRNKPRRVKLAAVAALFALLLGGVWVAAGGIAGSQDERVLKRQIEQANNLGKTWIVSNLRDKGLFVYSFNPETNELSSGNNAIRQLMASRVLAEESSLHSELLPLHEKNLNFLFEFWYRRDGDMGHVFFNDKSKLGANAMLLRTLVASPLYETYEEEARELYRGILALQEKNGAFRPWYVEPDYEYDADYLLTFYSGEALLALVEYYEKTGDPEALAAAKRSADFYINRYVHELSQYYYPAYVPWHTLALTKLHGVDPDARFRDAVFVMNDKLLELLDRSEFVGRFYNPDTPQYGSPHSSSDAVYTEGLAYALEMAKRVGDEEREARYREAIHIAVPNLISLQYQAPLYPKVEPERYVGALRIRENSSWIRVDTTQHAVDAFTHLLRVLE